LSTGRNFYQKFEIFAIFSNLSPYFYIDNVKTLLKRTADLAIHQRHKISSALLKWPAGIALPRGGDADWFLVFTGRPARSAAMPVLFLLNGPKMGFSPRRGDMLPRLTWNLTRGTGERTSPCQILRLSGRKCGNTAPKTVKISNFCQKFVPQGRLVCNIFTKFSRVYSYCFLLWFVVLVLV